MAVDDMETLKCDRERQMLVQSYLWSLESCRCETGLIYSCSCGLVHCHSLVTLLWGSINKEGTSNELLQNSLKNISQISRLPVLGTCWRHSYDSR